MQKILFVVILEEEPPRLDFSLKNLPGESKIDVIARNILNLFPRSNSQLKVSVSQTSVDIIYKEIIDETLVI